MQTGVIKKITEKGYGFIVPDSENGTQKDLFFHISEVAKDTRFNELQEGDQVEFEVYESPKGLCARAVRLANV